MLSPSSPARLSIAFDDDRLVAHAGLLLPATLAERLGLRELVDRHLDLGDAQGRANAGDKVATLVASVLAGGDCIDDADALRAGGTERVLGCTVKAPSTLGTFLRSFRWGHVRQLDRVSRALLARAWAAGAGPGEAPFTIDLDSTVCETYGFAKEGAQRPGYTGARGYHPLLAVAAGTGDVLMARLRGGRAYSGRGAAHFLQETVGRVRDAGANGQLTVRADSGFYSRAVVAACREMDVRFSVTIRQHPKLRRLIEAIPEQEWTPIPYWLEGGADVSETTYTPFAHAPDAVPVRLIVRRVRPTPGSQLALFATYSFRNPRTVARDNTVKYRWRTLQLLPGPERTSYAGTRVEVVERPDGELSVQHVGETIPSRPAPPRAGVLREARSELALLPDHERIAAGLGSGGAPRRLSAPPIAPSAVAAGNGAAVRPETNSKQLRAPTPRQLARWKAIQQAQLQGLSMRATARLLGIARDTVHNYVLANGVPGRRNGAAASSDGQGDTDRVADALRGQNR